MGDFLTILPQQRVLLGLAPLREVHVARFIPRDGWKHRDGYGKEWKMGVSR